MAGTLFPATGQREDLADIISVIDAKNTPLVSTARKGKDITNAGVYSFQCDKFNDPSFAGVLSDEDVSTYADPAANRAILSARAQKFRRAIKVDSFVDKASDIAGVKNQMANGVKNALVEIKRDMESAFCSNKDSVEQVNTTPYNTRGLFEWVKATAQAELPVPAAYRTPSASINTAAVAAVTETAVQDLLTSIYSQTGTIDDLVLLCGPSLKRAFTGFTRYATTPGSAGDVGLSIRTFNTEMSSKKIIAAVNVFEGDFGSLRLVPSLFLRKDQNAQAQAGSGLVADMNKIEIRFAQRPAFRELPDLGGGPRGLIDAIASVTCLAPNAMGKFTAAV
jgi:hypothetical protein